MPSESLVIIQELKFIRIHRESGWLTEIDPDNAIANTRVMGVVIGGILGGPIVGLEQV